jgi:hypothetical protein
MAQVVTQLFVDGAYASFPCYEAEKIKIRIGPDLDEELRPNTLDLTWQNPSGDMDPSNVASALYGKIGLNTTTRLRLGAGPTTAFVGEASQWSPDRTQGTVNATQGRAWVDMQAAGVAGRVGQWDDPLDSALTRQNSSINGLLGYWPLEGGSADTTRLQEVSAAPGSSSGSFNGTVTLGGDPGPGGGDVALKLGTGGALAARFARVFNSGYQLVFHARLPAVPSSAVYQNLIGYNLSNGNRIVWQVNNVGFNVAVTDPTGATIASVGTGAGAVDVTKWVRYRIRATFSAGTVTIEPAWYPQDASVITGYTFTYGGGTASGTGALLNWQVGQNAYNLDGAYGHVLATSDTTLDLTGGSNFVQAFNGYQGERAADRVVRLGGEQGIGVNVVGSAVDTVRMGRQKPNTLTALWEECRASDGALMYDAPNGLNLVFRTRRHRQDQAVQLTLSKATDIVPPFQPIIGPVLTRNDVTVTNLNGAEARSVAATGTRSVSPPPAGAGRYRKTIKVNLADDLLLDDRAEWEVNLGTVDRRWYRNITIDLLKSPALIDPLIALRPGDLITLTGAEPDDVSIHLINIEWTIESKAIKAVLTCVPADAWAVGKYDDTATRKGPTFATVGAAGATISATTLPVTNPVLADCWSTTASGYGIRVLGEVMTVTAASAPAGTGPYTQNLTVVRGVNGAARAHFAGETIDLAVIKRYGFL